MGTLLALQLPLTLHLTLALQLPLTRRHRNFASVTRSTARPITSLIDS